MSIAERACPLDQIRLAELQGIQRPYKERVRLSLDGDGLLVDSLFILSFKDLETGKQLAIARDVRVPVVVVKGDGSIRTYRITPIHDKGFDFTPLHLGFRPSRPLIFIKSDYKLAFVWDDERSLNFSLESPKEIRSEVVPENVAHEEILNRIARAQQYLDSSRGSKNLYFFFR